MMSRWSGATRAQVMGRQRAYGSDGTSYDAGLDGVRGLGRLAGGIRDVGLGAHPWGSHPWGSRPYGGLGQATPPDVVTAEGTPPVPPPSSSLAASLSSMTVVGGVGAAIGTGLSGATSGALVGAVAGGKGNRARMAGRAALAGATIANVAATVVGGIGWVGASQIAQRAGLDAAGVEQVRSGAMAFTLANAGLSVLEIAALVLTGAAK